MANENQEFINKLNTANAENFDICGVARANTSSRRFLDLEPKISVRDPYDANSYYNFRPGERPPTKNKDIIKACMLAYDTVGIIKNVIDLMGDFASQGITLVHTDKRHQAFYRKWWKGVDGTERSERFLNNLYRCGNVILQRELGTLSLHKKNYNNVPSEYKFLNPLSVEVKDGVAGLFLGNLTYEVNISDNLSEVLKNANTKNAKLNKEIKNKTIPLDPNKTLVFHYKKDDWQLWANPMIYAILDDIKMFEKMKLGDMAAMDGAISNVRLWRLGSLEHKIVPNRAMINKLRDILASNVGGGTIDLIWGPELEFFETESKVYNYLGDGKYATVLNSIYGGIGVPQTLTGSAGQSSGFTNNFISLKTLIDRLEYGRALLRKFWENELVLVQEAMGFAKPAQIHFDHMLLANETAEKNLLIQLADRNIISYETVRERLNELDNIEDSRVRKEEKQRTKERKPPKADPFHRVPEPMEEGGRPPASLDKIQRKQKQVNPKTSPTMTKKIVVAHNTFKEITDLVQKPMLEYFGKKNLRSLTDEEFNTIEELKFLMLCHSENVEDLSTLLSLELEPTIAQGIFEEYRADFIKDNEVEPTIEEERILRILAYVVTTSEIGV